MVLLDNSTYRDTELQAKIKEKFVFYKDSMGIYSFILEIIDEITDSPDFDCHDILALKCLIRDEINKGIDTLLAVKIRDKNIKYDDNDLKATSSRRINDVIFWGNGYHSRFQAEIILSRLSEAISYCADQQGCAYASSQEELDEIRENIAIKDKEDESYARNILNDFSNAVFGMDAELVESKIKKEFYTKSYDRVLCSSCPYSDGLEAFIEQRGAVSCTVRFY